MLLIYRKQWSGLTSTPKTEAARSSKSWCTTTPQSATIHSIRLLLTNTPTLQPRTLQLILFNIIASVRLRDVPSKENAFVNKLRKEMKSTRCVVQEEVQGYVNSNEEGISKRDKPRSGHNYTTCLSVRHATKGKTLNKTQRSTCVPGVSKTREYVQWNTKQLIRYSANMQLQRKGWRITWPPKMSLLAGTNKVVPGD